jgi:NDP-sugar pyrophosphorylase family protein
LGGFLLITALPVAVILAGGLGTRLRPVLSGTPKAMAPILGHPFLEHLLRDLSAAGIRTAILCVGYLKEQIRAYFGDGSAVGLAIRYAEEDAPLGTAGALGNARGMIGDTPFLLMNGDTYVSVDYKRLAAYHREKVVSAGAIGTIVVARVSDGSASGRIHLEEDGRIRSFREKEHSGASPCLANAGVYIFESDIFRFIPEIVPASLEHGSIPAALDAGRALYGFPTEGDFIDIGTPEGYQKMSDLLAKRKS